MIRYWFGSIGLLMQILLFFLIGLTGCSENTKRDDNVMKRNEDIMSRYADVMTHDADVMIFVWANENGSVTTRAWNITEDLQCIPDSQYSENTYTLRMSIYKKKSREDVGEIFVHADMTSKKGELKYKLKSPIRVKFSFLNKKVKFYDLQKTGVLNVDGN